MPYTRYIAYSGSDTIVQLMRHGATDFDPQREIALSGASPIILELETREPLEPRWRQRCSITLLSESHYAYEHILHDTRPWHLIVTHRNERIFRGIIQPGLYEEQYTALPYDVTLTAVDGLALLDDYELRIRALQTNAYGLISLYDLLQAAIQRIPSPSLSHPLTISISDTLRQMLAESYIAPEIYLTEGADNSRTYAHLGEIVDGILSSLALTIVPHQGQYQIYETTHHTPHNLALEEPPHPLIESASLASDSALGSVRITLPTDRTDSYTIIKPPQAPLPIAQPYNWYKTLPTLSIPLQELSATETLARSARKSQTHDSLIVDYKSEEAIAIALPYQLPRGAKGFKIAIEIGFPGTTWPEEEHDQIQGVIESHLADELWRGTMQATWTHHMYGYNIGKPQGCRSLPAVPEEERVEPNGQTIAYYYGKVRDQTASYTSRAAQNAHRTSQTHLDYSQYHNEINRHLPWSYVNTDDLQGGALATMQWEVYAPFPQTIECHDKEMQLYSDYKHYTFTPRYLIVYLPMRFWRIRGGDNIGTFTPSQVEIGHISIDHLWRRDPQYESYLDCDRDDGYLRQGDEIALSYTTQMPRIALSPALKGLLRDAQGGALERLPKISITPAERVARAFFSLYGYQSDRITCTTLTDSCIEPAQSCTLRGRAGHSYYVLGYRYDIVQGETELTLRSLPKKLETTQYA